MGNTDDYIEKIVNKQHQVQENTHETISFIAEDHFGTKPTEYIAFQDASTERPDDRRRGTPTYREMGGGSIIQDKIMSYRPFSASNVVVKSDMKDAPLDNKEIKLKDLLGIGGDFVNIKNYNGQSNMESVGFSSKEESNHMMFSSKEESKHRHNPRAEEINQFIDDLFSNPRLDKKTIEQQKYGFEEPISTSGRHPISASLPNRYNSIHKAAQSDYELPGNTPNLAYSHASPIKHINNSSLGKRPDFLFTDQQDYRSQMQTPPCLANTEQRWNMSTIYPKENQQTDCLLFRNPGAQQNYFITQGYSKMKRRRRIGSNTWYSAGGMLAVHPSKLSSLEFVHGGMSPMPMAGQGKAAAGFSLKAGVESGKVIENFRKQIDRLDFDNITVHELKNIMKDYGLNASGKKKEMIDRLKNTVKELGKRDEERDEQQSVNDKHSNPQYDKYFF